MGVHSDDQATERAAAGLFRALGDSSRLAILRHLLLGDHTVSELTAHLGLAQSTVSKHLACLRDCGLVRSRPRGRASLFSLSDPDVTRTIFVAAEEVLRVTGNAVMLCPTADPKLPSTSVEEETP